MILANTAQESWLQKFQELMHHLLPALPNSAAVNVGGLVAICVGLFLALRAGKFERIIVCAFALVVGGLIGQRLAVFINGPVPVTIAIASVALAAVAYKSYRVWLAIGSVVVLFSVATMFQLGRSDLQENLLRLLNDSNTMNGERISLAANQEEQHRNLHDAARRQVERIKENVVGELRQFGVTGWIIPVAAAIAGGLLAFWALRAFSVVWIGFIGAHVAVLGACTVLFANWPVTRDAAFAKPHYVAYIALGIWLIGLVLQAKEARFPKKSAPAEAKEPTKS